jgi:membrane-bound metal-dependent hydrolase YbcI (DUF457 family)
MIVVPPLGAGTSYRLIAMDIEPGIGVITGANVLHGVTHSFLGALIIACVVMLIAPSFCDPLLRKWNKKVIHYNLPWLLETEAVSKVAVITGALFGTMSHAVLDSLMHPDMQPLLPFSQNNPVLGLVTHDGAYQLTTVAGVLGAVLWLTLKRVNRSTKKEALRCRRNT